MTKKQLLPIKSTKYSEFRGFMSAVIDIATKPQVFKQWIKEKKAWKNTVNMQSKGKMSDPLVIKHKKKGEKSFTEVVNER